MLKEFSEKNFLIGPHSFENVNFGRKSLVLLEAIVRIRGRRRKKNAFAFFFSISRTLFRINKRKHFAFFSFENKMLTATNLIIPNHFI